MSSAEGAPEINQQTKNMVKLLAENGSGRGLISVCTAGGMGVTAILERP